MTAVKDIRVDTLTLDEAMKLSGISWTGNPHVLYDPDMVPQYWIRRHHSHDGTLLFTAELVQEALRLLMECRSFYKPEPGEPGQIPEYTVGPIIITSDFKRVDLPAGNYPGVYERLDIPVRVRWFIPTTPTESAQP